MAADSSMVHLFTSGSFFRRTFGSPIYQLYRMSDFQHLFPLLLKNEQLNQRQQALFLKWCDAIEKKSTGTRTSEDWFVLGVKAQFTEDRDEAEFCFTEAIRKEPNFEAAFQRRGSVYTDSGDFKRAEADFSKALELDPSFTQAYVSRAVLYTEMEAYDKAIADLDHVLSEEADHAGAIITKATVFEYSNEYDKAAETLNALIESYPKDAELYAKRALYRLFADKPAEALADMTLSARFGQGSSVSDFNYGLIYGLMPEHTKDAFQRFERAFKKQPAILKQYHESAKPRDWERLYGKLKQVLNVQKANSQETGRFYRDQLIDLLERMLRDFN
jgi:tetratricopeptide (TPR) repeat protein